MRNQFTAVRWDSLLHLEAYTASGGVLFSIGDHDLGRPVASFPVPDYVSDLQALIVDVAKKHRPKEREVQDEKGRWLSLRIQPDLKNGDAGVLLTAVDINQYKRASEQRGYMEMIVDTVREPLLVLDRQLKVKIASRSFYHTFHVSPEETENRVLSQLGDGQWDIPKLAELLEGVSSGQPVNDFEVEHDFPEIGYRIIHLNAHEIYQPPDRSPLVLVAIEDVTQRVQAQRELERTNAGLRDFADFAAHDLKAPLRRISSYTDLLQSKIPTAPESDAVKYIDRIRQAAAHMKELIDDLLDFAAINDQQGEFSEVDLSAVLRSIQTQLEPELMASGGTILIPQNDWPKIRGKEIQICRLLSNLLSNALKYRRAGVPPAVTVTYSQEDGRLQLSIEDNGIGFREDMNEAIFRPFFREHAQDAIEGTGMGLAIAEKVVRHHNGSISATSIVGKGSVFTITLPTFSPR